MVFVKICGLMNADDISACWGADALGFIVHTPGSRRNLRTGDARMLVREAQGYGFSAVLVISGEAKNRCSIDTLISALEPDMVQAHFPLEEGDASALGGAGLPWIGVVEVERAGVEGALRTASVTDTILLDTAGGGGSGRLHDWDLSRRVVASLPGKRVILSGGLTPENVARAVEHVRPYGVDVSTGVERDDRPGKDIERTARFIREAKRYETKVR